MITRAVEREYNRRLRRTMEKWSARFLKRVKQATTSGDERSELSAESLSDAWETKVSRYRGNFKLKVYLGSQKQKLKFKYAYGPKKAKIIRKKDGGVFRVEEGAEGKPFYFRWYVRKARGQHVVLKKLKKIERDIERRAQKDIDRVISTMIDFTFSTTVKSIFGK